MTYALLCAYLAVGCLISEHEWHNHDQRFPITNGMFWVVRFLIITSWPLLWPFVFYLNMNGFGGPR